MANPKNESPVARQTRLQKQRDAYANLSPEKKAARLEYQRNYYRDMSPEQKAALIEYMAWYHRLPKRKERNRAQYRERSQARILRVKS